MTINLKQTLVLLVFLLINVSVHSELNFKPTGYLALDIRSTDISCPGNNDGEIEIIASGGSGDYKYSINNGITWQYSGLFANLSEGNYTVIVVDNILSMESLPEDIYLTESSLAEINLSAISPVCDGITTLTSQLPSNAIWAYWQIEEGSGSFEDAASNETSVTELGHGSNVFSWNVFLDNGCSQTTFIEVINNQPSEAAFQDDISSVNTCGSSYSLEANLPTYGTGRWYVIRGSGTFTDNTNPQSEVKNLSKGENILRWVVSNNTCLSMKDFNINNLKVEVSAGQDTTVCSTIAQLHASPAMDGTIGEWSIVNGIGSGGFQPSSDNPNATVSSLGNGNNALIWSIENEGCISVDTVIVRNDRPKNVQATPLIETDNNYTTLIAAPPVIGLLFIRIIVK